MGILTCRKFFGNGSKIMKIPSVIKDGLTLKWRHCLFNAVFGGILRVAVSGNTVQ
jgi:hypothetical protein